MRAPFRIWPADSEEPVRPVRAAPRPRRCAPTFIDEQVDVGRIIRVSASDPAEDADIAEAVSLRKGSDLRSVGLNQGVH